jgi:hypothetical protein
LSCRSSLRQGRRAPRATPRSRRPAPHRPAAAPGLGGPGRVRCARAVAAPRTASPSSGHSRHDVGLASSPRAPTMDLPRAAASGTAVASAAPNSADSPAGSWPDPASTGPGRTPQRVRGGSVKPLVRHHGCVLEPRWAVHDLVRRRVAGCGHQRGQDPAALSAGELLRRALRVDRPHRGTDRMLIFGERHLRTVLARYAVHYNAQRPHRSQQLRPPRPESPVSEPIRGRIRRRPILGGLINEYETAA